MKKITVVALAAFALIANATLFAGSFDYLSNQSAGYFINSARTATTDGADAAAYNPAGTALLEKGFYFDFSSQTFLKDYSEEAEALGDDAYKQNEPTLFLPNLFIVYNYGQLGPGKLAVYGSAGIVAGGGDLNWKDGTVGSNAYLAGNIGTVAALTGSTATGYSSSVEASSVYYGFGGGLSYALLDDKVSASAGLRYTMARRSGKIEGTFEFNHAVLGDWTLDVVDDYEYTAAGFTPIFGLDVRPIDKLTLGVRYEMETDLTFKYKVNEVSASVSNAAFAGAATAIESQLPDYDGQKVQHNLPQILSIGADYQATEKLAVSAAATFYFMGSVDYETPDTNSSTDDSIDVSDYFGTGYELSVGGRYLVLDNLLVGGTFMYTSQGAKDKLLEETSYLLTTSANPVLNSYTVGLGVQYGIIKNLDLLASAGWIQYITEDVTNGALDIKYEKRVINFCIGAKYKI